MADVLGLTFAWLVVGALVVLFTSGPVFLLMHKQRLPGKYWSLIPLVHLFFLAQIGEKSPWRLLLLVVPLVNLFVMIDLWYGASENVGVSTVWAWFWIIPLLGVFASWMIALNAPSGEWRPRRP